MKPENNCIDGKNLTKKKVNIHRDQKNTIAMMTNIRLSVANGRPNAEASLKAKYLLSMVKMRTGINENLLLPELILEGLKYHEITSKYYYDLQKDWELYKTSNNINSDQMSTTHE